MTNRLFGPELFGVSDDTPEPTLSDAHIEAVLEEIKLSSRNRRIAMIAPVALAAAVLGTMAAAPPQYGGLAVVAEADASAAQLPHVFGANGVWRLAEPIDDAPADPPGPASLVEAPSEPSAPSFVLAPPDQEDLSSFPASASTPPAPTPGQSLAERALEFDAREPAGPDWSAFSAPIRVGSGASAGQGEYFSPGPVAAAQATTSAPEHSSPDEDVTVAALPRFESTGGTASAAVNAGGRSRANPSTPVTGPSELDLHASSEAATIVPRSVLVHSAHVSVKVQVIDVDSAVIDWCNTRVDWGDGSITGVVGTNGVATCTASCEYAATPLRAGIDVELVFTHEYTAVIDAAPVVYVATGDGCRYTLAEIRLNAFTVTPY